MTRILIAGYFGRGNAGDEAILEGMLRDLHAEIPGADLTVVSHDPSRTRAVHGVVSVPHQDVPGLIEQVRESDLVILGGGGLFHDYWPCNPDSILTPSQSGLCFYTAIPLLAGLLGTPCMIYAAGVGPLRGEEARESVRQVFHHATAASVRDPESLSLLQSIGALRDGLTVEVTADPAFTAVPASKEEARRLLSLLGVAATDRPIGIAPRHWNFNVDPHVWQAELARALDLFCRHHSASIVFMPFQQEAGSVLEDDTRVCHGVRDAMIAKDRVAIVEEPIGHGLLRAVISECQLVIAMRMHAALFALASGVPVVGLAYDPKVVSLMAKFGLDALALSPQAWQAERIVAAMTEAETVPRPPALRGLAATLEGLARRNAQLAAKVLDDSRRNPAEDTDPLRRYALRKTLQVSELWHEVRRIERLKGELEAESRRFAASTESLRHHRDLLLTERNELQVQLHDLKSTVGVRLLGVYWGLMRRMFPEGGRGRQVYSFLRRLLRGGWRTFLIPAPDSLVLGTAAARVIERIGASTSLLETRAVGAARMDLLSFIERVEGQRAEVAVVVLAATQPVGSEGQRSTQLALELARRKIPVIFGYWRWSAADWRSQDMLELGVFQIPLDVLARYPSDAFDAWHSLERLALFEFPYPGLFSALAHANSTGWITVYDVVDDWQQFHRVGQAPWYDEAFERHMLTSTDLVIAVTAALAERVRQKGREEVRVIPNGVRPGIEEAILKQELPRGELTLGYFGYLSDAWFDWTLVTEAARAKPSWMFHLIGYGADTNGRKLPPNVLQLGKVPQEHLASFAVHWDIGIVPFKRSRLALAADPIKTYEYLAMGLPVVVTGVLAPEGAERWVLRADGPMDFIEKAVQAAMSRHIGIEARREFAGSCTWARRVDSILEMTHSGQQRVAEKRALFRRFA